MMETLRYIDIFVTNFFKYLIKLLLLCSILSCIYNIRSIIFIFIPTENQLYDTLIFFTVALISCYLMFKLVCLSDEYGINF